MELTAVIGDLKKAVREAGCDSLALFTPEWRNIPPNLAPFWREVFDPLNLKRACRRVVGNGGCPGRDAMTVRQLPAHLSRHLPLLLTRILRGEYRPVPPLVVDVAKPSGSGLRRLRIPSVVDRFVQQAILQVLEPRLDPGFSNSSFGYRLGRSAHDAVGSAQRFINRGLTSVLHLDIENFFDRVRHEDALRLVAPRVGDGLCLHLLRCCLESGVFLWHSRRHPPRGLPQGSPLSPMLANVVLHELDTALETREQPFVRYADDCILLARVPDQARRLHVWVADFLRNQLSLDLNPEKTAIVRPDQLIFLGFTFHRNGEGIYRRQVSPFAIADFRARVRDLISNPDSSSGSQPRRRLEEFVRGWMESFSFCETPAVPANLREFVQHELRHAGAARRQRVEQPTARADRIRRRNSLSAPHPPLP